MRMPINTLRKPALLVALFAILAFVSATGSVAGVASPAKEAVTIQHGPASSDPVVTNRDNIVTYVEQDDWRESTAGSNGEQKAKPGSPDSGPVLEPGFPVDALHSGGSFAGGPIIHTLVGNIDDDPTLEIIVQGLASGPLYAFNSDGSRQSGWPMSGMAGPNYPALGNLSSSNAGLEVFTTYSVDWDTEALAARTGLGKLLPGWPVEVDTPSIPVMADVDGDGIDEVFVRSQEVLNPPITYVYNAAGNRLEGWDYSDSDIRGWSMPAILDLDGDGSLELVSVTAKVNSSYPGIYVYAVRQDGSLVPGFPVNLPATYTSAAYPVVGDVDADRSPEIIVPYLTEDWMKVAIINKNGQVEHTITAGGANSLGTPPVLADLDNDAIPEIILQTQEQLEVWKGDGTVLPGWPQKFVYKQQGFSAPVVGDLDGDGEMDIAIITQWGGSAVKGDVRVFNRNGGSLTGFPMTLNIGAGAVPAIADMDQDGRNELIVTGNSWDGASHEYDKVWAFDWHGEQPYGRIEWGQFQGGPRHRGVYPPGGCGISFRDVPIGSAFHDFVQCLACRGVVSGTGDGNFHPNQKISRGQLSKIVANSANLTDAPGEQLFEDVPPDHTFYLWVQRLAAKGFIGGYPCGTEADEPCQAGNRPYFRPAGNATRGQISKIVSNAAGYTEEPGEQRFEDVVPGSPFYDWIQRLASRAVIGGYPCGTGGPGEPCVAPANRSYFRPNENASRGQVSKIVANTFYPGCASTNLP